MKQFVELKNYSGWKQFKQCFGGPEKNFVSFDNRGMMSFMSKYAENTKVRNAALKEQGFGDFKQEDYEPECYRKEKGPKDAE